MQITKEQIEKLAAAKSQEQDDGPIRDNSYVLEDVKDMKNRLMVDIDEENIPAAVKKLIQSSVNHPGTGLYDTFQVQSNGIKK